MSSTTHRLTSGSRPGCRHLGSASSFGSRGDARVPLDRRGHGAAPSGITTRRIGGADVGRDASAGPW